MKTKIVTSLTLLAASALPLVPSATAASDGVYPLTENSWDNPDFKKRFLGSYGFDMEINPKITREESEVMGQVAEFMNSDPNQAIALLQAGMTPESSAAFDYTIGSLYLQQGKMEQAKAAYRTAIEKFPNFYRAYQNLGFTLVRESAYAEAKPMLIEAIEIGGGNGTLYGLLGYCFLNLEQSSLALDAYRQALLFQPDSNDWLLGKLNSLLDTGMTQEAIGMLSNLIEKDPSKANFWMMQANAYMGERQFDKALANLELVSRMNQASPSSLALLGDLYLNEGLAALALERYTEASEAGQLPASKLLKMAEGLTLRGSFAEAAELVDTISGSYADLSPEDEMTALNIQAKAYMAQGEMVKAASILEDIVSKDPLNGKALISLGDYYREKGDTERAMVQYERASKVSGFEAQGLIALARLEVSLKQYKSAVINLKRANAFDSKPYIEDYIERLETAIKSI